MEPRATRSRWWFGSRRLCPVLLWGRVIEPLRGNIKQVFEKLHSFFIRLRVDRRPRLSNVSSSICKNVCVIISFPGSVRRKTCVDMLFGGVPFHLDDVEPFADCVRVVPELAPKVGCSLPTPCCPSATRSPTVNYALTVRVDLKGGQAFSQTHNDHQEF